jgi:hypothetical protein
MDSHMDLRMPAVVQRQMAGPIRLKRLMMAITALVAGLLAIASGIAWRHDGEVMWALIAVVLGAITVAQLRNWWAWGRDLRAGVVRRYAGPVWVQEHKDYDGDPLYSLTLGHPARKLDIPDGTAKTAEALKEAVVDYLPRSGTLLGIWDREGRLLHRRFAYRPPADFAPTPTAICPPADEVGVVPPPAATASGAWR